MKTDLLPAAYACKCTFDTYTGLDTPQQIQIRTLNNFDATYPAGSDVTAYFRTIPRAYGQKQQFLPVAAAGTGIQQNDATGEVGFDLYLYEQPGTDTLHYFELNILLQDGRTLTDTTDQVIIRR